MGDLRYNGFSAEMDVDPETTLLRGKVTQTGTVFYAKYVHQLESRFKAIVDNGWFTGDMPSRLRH